MATILIIDDQLVSRQIHSALIGSINKSHEIRTFTCPLEALNWATKNPVILVLTDYKMPEMNGIEFLRLLRSHPLGVHVPVIMVSADNDSGIREEALEAGATDFLVKPLNHHECRERCRALLEDVT